MNIIKPYNNSNRKINEIIEIGAVKLNDNLQNIGAFKMFVRPNMYSYLNKHVGKITNITMNDLKYGLPFYFCSKSL